MNAVIVQLDSAWEDKAANSSRARALGGSVEPGSLIVLPEMFATGFSLDAVVTAEPDGGPTEQFLRSLAAEHAAMVIGGLIRRDESGRAWNEALAVSPGGETAGRYAKQRPFSGAGEDAIHARGSAPVVFEHGGFRIAPFICYDLRFPELFREAVRAGADLLVVIAAWPLARIGHWTTLLCARAIENQAAVIGVNRTGREPRFDYNGHSMVVNCQGSVLCDAGEAECAATVALDPREIADWRRNFPALRDAGLV